MENSKVNSQALIAGAVGRNDDVFSAINFPDSHIFSLQRFADVTLRQEGGSATTLLSPDSLTGVLSAYTLGRSASETQIAGTVLAEAGSEITVGGTHFYIAPLFDGTNTYKDESYKLTAYNLGVNGNASDVRIAIAYNDLPAHSTTGTSPTYNYMVGILTSDTNVLIGPDNPSFNYPTQAPWSGTYKLNDGQYESLYKMMLNGNEMRFGSSTGVVASSAGKFNITLDFYDVKLGSHTNVAALNALETGTYVYRDTSDRAIDFKAKQTLTFDNIEAGESETYKINGVNVLLQGGSNAATTTFTADSYSTSGPQTFSEIGFDSSVSIAFTLDGLGSTGVILDGVTYTSANNSGTVMFSASGTSNFITLGKGDFALTASTETGLTYNLDSNASGTFTVAGSKAFILDVDGTATGFAPVTFSNTGSANGTVIAQYGDSNITLGGTFSLASDSITKLAFALSDTSAATIGGYQFTDAENGSNTFVQFSTESDINIGGVFTSIYSGTSASALTGVAFNLADSTTAQLGAIGVSDTADGDPSYIQFGPDSNTFTLAGDMAVSGTFTNATFTLSDVAVYKINGKDYEVKTTAGIGDANKLTFINTNVTVADSFGALDTSSLVAAVTGYSAGANISVDTSTAVTIDANSAQLLGTYYFGTAKDATASGTVQFSNTGIVLTGNLIASTANGTELIGLNGESFTATAGTFFVKDSGTVTINTLGFTDASDGFVSELVYDKAASSMGVYGAFTLNGSDTGLVYTLNGFNDSNSSIVMSGIKFDGSGTSVQNSAANAYKLTNSGTDVFNITGTVGAADSFTLLSNSTNYFKFGSVEIGGSETGLNQDVTVSNFGVTNLASNTTFENGFTIGDGLVKIKDAEGSETFRIDLVGDSMSGATISDIDAGATIYKVASATSVVTNGGNGLYTFSTTAVAGVTGTATQIFSITGDTDGVTFGLNDSGMVVSISGIDAGATVSISDLTIAGITKNNGVTKTGDQLTDGKWERNVGTGGNAWAVDQYMGYIITASGSTLSYTVQGIESTTAMNRATLTDYTELGQSGTTFTVNESVFNTATQVIFQNTGYGTGYAAQLSGTTTTPIFSALKGTGEGYGVLMTSSNTSTSLSLANVPDAGTATALTAMPEISSELSLTLADYALDVYTGYNVSGTGVGVAVSNTVTVSANGGTAVVGMPNNDYITFGQSSGTYVLNGITTNTLFVDATKESSAAVGTNSSVFALSLTGGAIVSDTFNATASELSINNITYRLVSTSSTFVYSTASDASDTLAVNAGFLTADNLASNSAIFNSVKYKAASNTGLYFGAYSYTGISETTAAFSLTKDESGTQVASVTGGVLQESVAADAKFAFTYSDTTAQTYTALEGGVLFNIGSSTETFISGSGTRELGASTFELAGGSKGELSDTFVFNSGTILLTVGETSHGATESIREGTGTYTGATFNISDFYLRETENGDNNSGTKIYNYTVLAGGTGTLTWVVDATNGIGASNTMTLSTGFGATRDAVGAASNTTFQFATGENNAELTNYTATSENLAFYLSAESATLSGAAGVIYNGVGTRDFVDGSADSSIAIVNVFNSDTYKLSGGLVQVTVESATGVTGAADGASATFIAQDGGLFHFIASGSSIATAYTSTGVTTLYGLVSANGTNTSISELYNAVGAGTRTGSGTYTVAALSDTFTMGADATLTLTLSGSETFSTIGVEQYTGGYGSTTYNGATFALNDAWLQGNFNDASTNVFVYTALTGDSAVTLGLTLEGTTGTIAIEAGLGTRTATMTEQTFIYNGATYTTTNLGSVYTFAIGGSGTTLESIYSVDSATGVVYTGAGSREFVSGTDVVDTVLKFNSDTYTFTGGQLNMNLDAGSATFSAGAGTATYEAVAYTEALATAGSNTTFHFAIGNGEALLYTATAVTTLEGQVNDAGSITVLLSAEGSGTRLLGVDETLNTYTVTALGDAYVMQEGSTLELEIGGVGIGTETFIAGTGTLTGTSFTLNDKWLAGGLETGDTTYTYEAVAGSEATLALTLTGRDSGTIEITSGFGTRTSELTLGSTFNYAGDIYTATQTSATFGIGVYTNTDGVNYNVATATGMLYSGAGVRDFNSASDTDKLSALEFNSDTNYTFIGGQLNLTLTTGTAVYSAGAGSATYTAAANTGVFHFGANTYTATTETVLYGTVADTGSITGLYNATGAGTREGSGTYTIAALSDTFNMDATSVLTIDFGNGGINASETYTSGSGSNTFTTFALNDDWLEGGDTGTQIFNYTSLDGSNVTLALTLNGSTGTIKIDAGFATRTETGTTFSFGGDVYTTTANTNLTYGIGKGVDGYDVASASGLLYTAEGTRSFSYGTNTNLTQDYLNDTYKVTDGVMSFSLNAGVSETMITGGTGTYTADATGDNKTFHFSSTYGTFAYTAITETTLGITFDNTTSTTNLISASGAGTRNIETATSFALSALNNDSYTFTAGSALISITDVSTYNETAYAGTGSATFADGATFYAAFDASDNYDSSTAFTYTASGTAVLNVTLAEGEVKKQSIVDGAGYRDDTATDTTFTYEYDGTKHVYSATSVASPGTANLKFVLNSDTAAAYGAFGGFYSGVGYRNGASSDTYTPDGGQEYTLDKDAEWQLTVADGANASETLYTANTSLDFNENDTFTFKGTTYTVDTTTAVLSLTATKGEITEMFASGTAIFNGTSSDTTFTYDTNEYNVVGSATLRLTAGQTEPTFVSGKGQKAMSETDVFKFTPDSNTYTVTSANALLTAVGNSGTAIVTFESGTAVDKLAKGDEFYFVSSITGKFETYTAGDEGAVLGLSSTQVTGASELIAFIGGSGDRIETGVALGTTFTFDGNTYNSTSDTFTWTLSLSDTNVVENVTGAEGSRTVTADSTFTYISLFDNATHTYTAQSGSDVSLAISLVGGNGTETMTAGAATRDMASGTTFNFAPDALFGGSTTFTATAAGTYQLKAVGTATEGMETLSQTDYNANSVTETILGVTATGTYTDFAYTAIVTNQSETYTSAGGVTFELTIDGDTNTVTWQSGSATMTLDSTRTFDYTVDNASHTYNVDTAGVTFTRTSQTEEYLSDGIGYRALESGSGVFNVTYLSDTYTADAGRINLNASGTTAYESFNSGTAAFALTDGGTFHYTVGGVTNLYDVTESGTLQVNVADGSATTLFAVSGAGKRSQGASETFTTEILSDTYNVTDGVFSLSLDTNNLGKESETLTGGAGVFTTTSTFHVSDFYLGNGTDTTSYGYTALGGSEVQLALTINGADSQTIQLTSGIGTREYDSETFTFNVGGTDYNYTASGTIVNAISADSQTSAAGYIYNAVGTRDGADTNTTFYFNEDLYTAQSGTMQLTVTEGVGAEDMISGTATYVANSGDTFHYDLSNTGVVRAYTALSETTLMTTFSDGTGTAVFAAISGAGTRDATASDTSFTYTYEEDTYNAVAGSSTILLDATTDDVFETLYGGLVVDEVAANDNFHYNVDGTLYAYTAQSETTIEYTIGADSGTKSFTANPYGTRTATDTTFNINSHDYTLNSGESETYLLSGTGTALVDSLYTANGYRTDVQNETYTSLWNNTYSLSSGTYTIAVTGGVGTETLTTASAELAVTAGGSVNYGDSSTAYTANMDGATLNFSVENSVESEALTAGAINYSNTYIVASGNFTVGTAGNAVLTAPTADSSTLVTVTAGDAITAISDSLTGAFASGNFLNVNDKVIAAESAATLNIYGISNVEAASGSFTAQGDFTGGNFIIDSGTVQVDADTDITVAFDTSAITAINNLTDGVTVINAAGASKAFTDSTGTFKFENTVTAGQSFNISTDNEVTFQIDSDGIVTNIAGLNYDGTDINISITDGNWTSDITVTDTGVVLTRNSLDGTWTAGDVQAVAYVVEVASDSSVLVSAIDANSNTTKIDSSKLGTSSTSTGAIAFTINSGVDVAETPVYVENNATDTVINVTGYVTGIGNTAEDMAVRIDSTESGIVNIYKASTSTFDSVAGYTIANGTFSVGTSGEVTLAAAGSALASVTTADATVSLKAETTARTFAVNDSDAQVTLAVGDADTNGVGYYGLQLESSALTGLNPNDVETGTVKLASSKNADTTTTFKINDASVSVTNDNDRDGITLEIQDDKLYGLNNVSTDATITASGVESGSLVIDGDSDNAVTVTTDTIRYNTTDSKWIAGDAPAKVATGYLVTVDSSGTVHLAYTDSTHTDTTVTTNKNDYAAAFTNLSLDEDGGTLPTYGGSIDINSGLASTVGVSVVTAYGEGINITDSTDTKALTLVTANGNFSVNGQEIIPSATVNVTAISGGAQVALTSDVTITHSSMGFTATSDTSATFTSDWIILNDTTKVTNTDSTAQFSISKGTVTFDGIAVKGEGAAVTNVAASSVPSGLTVNDKDLLVTGGDLNYTVDVSTDTVVISGITSAATVEGALVAGAVVQTDATGTYKIASSNEFTITGDSAVDFAVGSNSVVSGISGVGSDTVTGSVIGDFTNAVAVNGKTVLVSGDELVSVSANGTQVTQIDGVGASSNEETVSVANAGGATIVNTDATGNFYFGDGTVNSQLFVVGDDAQVGFLTSSLSGDVPSVVGVTNFDEGTLEIAQSVTAFTINNENAINIANDSSDQHVTLGVGSSVITAVHGLTGSVSGLSTGVAVEVIDSDVSINGAQLSVSEVESLNVVASAVSGTGYDVVTGLNTNATVNVAKNVSVKTEEAGVFTFVDDIFTITGDPSVTFETDGNSRVKNVADFAGTLTSTESDVTVNGAAISMTNTDASITAAAGNVTISGLADGDSVTAPSGAVIEMPGTTTDNTDTSITVNGKPYTLEGDGDGIAITTGTPTDTVNGLDAGARLTVGSAGDYNVNGSALTASIGAVIVGDAEGAAHVASVEDITFDSDTSTDEVINKILNGDVDAESTDKYVDHVTDTSRAAALIAEGGSALDGNLDMVIGDSDTSESQTADFSNNKGIKKVTMGGNNAQDVKFNDEGGNVAIIGAGVEGEKNVSLGAGGDLAVVEKTDTPVNITAGKGRDTIVSQGRNTSVNISAGGPTRLMATAGNLNVTGYDHTTGAGVQLTNSDVARAVQRNAIQLANGSVGVNGATVNLNLSDDPVGSSIVNFYNLKGKMTKVGFTHSSGGTVDLSSEKSDVVLKGNYSGANDQDDSARAGKKDGGSTLIGGAGNDSAFGGAGDRLNLGNGDNYIGIDNKRTNSDVGATIEQTATQGRTVVEGFNNNDFSDMGDRIRISTSASVKFVNGVLTFVFGAAQLIINGVTSAITNSSSSDLAESADIVNGDYSFARTLIENADGSVIKAAVAEDGKWIQVTSANAEDYLATAYLGTNSGIDFASYDGTVNLTLADGENFGSGNVGGTDVNVRGITKIQLGSNDASVIGAASTNNTIAAGTGNASMWGGGASNDTLIGNTVHSGSTNFFYFDGNGRDFIQDFEFLESENHSTADRLNILNSGLSNALADGNDLVVEFGNTEDRLTIKDGIGKDIVVERGTFGSRYDSLIAQVNTTSLNYDGQANYFYALGKNATVSVSSDLYNAEVNLGDNGSFAGDIKVLNASGVQGNTTLMGNSNDNTIFGSSENSSMWGGAIGNDTLVGGEGLNAFFYGKNNGNDVAVNVDGNDIVNLYDISIDDIEITSETGGEMIGNNAVTITLKDSAGGGTLTVQTSDNGTGFRMANGQTYVADHQNRTWSVK